MDVLITRTPAVLVPFSQEGETEQTTRAEVLALLSGFNFVPEPELTVERLAGALDEVALDYPASTPFGPINMNGAVETAKVMLHLATLKH
jgi:predicted glycosyltransferase